MAYFGISRPEGLPRRRSTPPSHETWDRRLHTGSLTLSLVTAPDRFVSPSTGRLVLTELAGEKIVALEAARARGVPVVPGSGIKGAVRTIYELLSCSCDPFARSSRCEVKPARGRGRRELDVCEACSLFGCLGWTGRVTFSDATPAEKNLPITVEKVPLPWKPKADRTGGEFRFYDQGETLTQDRQRGQRVKAPKKLAREGYRGQFRTRMTFWNATPEELGRLLLAMGLADGGKNRFHLRLGGAKYDGQGAVAVQPVTCTLVHPTAETLDGADCRNRCEGWLAVALAAEGFRPFQQTLEELTARLKGGRE